MFSNRDDSSDYKRMSDSDSETTSIEFGVRDSEIKAATVMARQANQLLEQKTIHFSDEPSSAFRTNYYVYVTRACLLLAALQLIASPIIYLSSDDDQAKFYAAGFAMTGTFFALVAAGIKCHAYLLKRETHEMGIFNPYDEQVRALAPSEVALVQASLTHSGLDEIKIDHTAGGQTIRTAEQALGIKVKQLEIADKENKKLLTTLFKALPKTLPTGLGHLIYDYALDDPRVKPRV